MLGYRIFPYCFDMPHLIICARERCWGCRERSLLSILTSLPRISFLTPAGWNLGGSVCLGNGLLVSLPAPHTPHAMTASSGHPDRRRGARSFTSLFMCGVSPSCFHHQSGPVCQASSHLGIPSRVDVDMGSQLRPRMAEWPSMCIQQVAESAGTLSMILCCRIGLLCLRHLHSLLCSSASPEKTALLEATVPLWQRRREARLPRR